jgi:indolepyruvate decarboxylase
MGIYTAKLDRARTILATTESIQIRYHKYDNVSFGEYLGALAGAASPSKKSRGQSNGAAALAPKKFRHPNPRAQATPLLRNELTEPLTMKEVMRILSLHLDENCCLVCDVGDGLFGAIGIRTARQAEFIAPAYYLSMGFAVPASIGVAIANPALRPFVLVGDGAFQMTGTELSTAVRLGLRPIVLVLNNDGYGTMRKIRDGRFNVISQWDYGKICDLIGGGSATRAATKGELDGALRSALGSTSVRVIDVQIPRDDMSPQLASMSSELARLRGAKK